MSNAAARAAGGWRRPPTGSSGATRQGGATSQAVLGIAGVFFVLLTVLALIWYMVDHQHRVAVEAELAARRVEEQMHEARREAEARAAGEERGPLGAGEAAEPRAPAGALERDPTPSPARSFDGVGTIRGRITATTAEELPQEWAAILSPSASLVGSSLAVHRRLDHEGGGIEFDFGQVPLGGYELRIEGPGVQSRPRQVLLAAGQAEVYLTVPVLPTGSLSGSIQMPAGVPMDGLWVILEHAATGTRRQTWTDGAGGYRFEDVCDGGYILFLGGATAPIRPPLELSFQAPHMTVPTQEFSNLGVLDVRVVDAYGQRVAGATVRGYGDRGGQIVAESDSRGEAVVRFLPAGRYTVYGSLDEIGSGRTRVELQEGERKRANLVLERR